MPALPDVPGVIRFEVNFTVGTDAAALVRAYWSYTGGVPTPGDMAAFAGQLYSAYSGPGVALYHTDTTLDLVQCVDLSSSTGSTGEAAGPLVGTRAGESLGADVCALMNFSIGRRYRGGKPRMYLPYGVADDLLTRRRGPPARSATGRPVTPTLGRHSTGTTSPRSPWGRRSTCPTTARQTESSRAAQGGSGPSAPLERCPSWTWSPASPPTTTWAPSADGT